MGELLIQILIKKVEGVHRAAQESVRDFPDTFLGSSPIANETHGPHHSADFAEPLLKSFDANVVESIDASDYEGSTIIADFNKPLGCASGISNTSTRFYEQMARRCF
jgi:hypothetical protein